MSKEYYKVLQFIVGSNYPIIHCDEPYRIYDYEEAKKVFCDTINKYTHIEGEEFKYHINRPSSNIVEISEIIDNMTLVIKFIVLIKETSDYTHGQSYRELYKMTF